MKKTSKTIIFFGSGPVAAASLEYIAKHFNIEAIITKATPPHHKGIAPVEELASSLNLPILFSNTKQDLDNLFDAHKFKSEIGIIVDYGVIVSQKIIDNFRLGIINSHFSLLPEWRGADPITYSLLSDQTKTGVSLMIIRPELDTGRLIAQEEITISPSYTVHDLTSKLIELSNKMLAKYLPLYINGEITPYEQPNQDKASYSHKIHKLDGIIDSKKTAKQLEREVRAYYGWPGSQLVINSKTKIIVKKAHISNKKETPIDVLCSDGRYLVIDELIAPSGRRMSVNNFLNGHKIE